MQIILFLNKDAKVRAAVNSIQLKHHRVVALENEKFFKHYLEEYMPGYIIVSSEMHNIEEIIEFTRLFKNTRLIITCNDKSEIRPDYLSLINRYGTLVLDKIGTLPKYKKILKTIDGISQPGKHGGISELKSLKIDQEIRFINQQVVSVFSSQGGIGRTAIAANIACFFGKTGKIKVLLFDMNFAEGPSDLSLKMRLPQYPNLDIFIEEIHESYRALNESVMKVKELNIDVLLPPVTLYRSDKFDTELLNSLIFTARSTYNYIIVDLPNRFDSIFMEMLNLSTIVLFLTGPELQQVLKPQNYIKFLPPEQKRGLVINNINKADSLDLKNMSFIVDIPVYGVIPLIKKNEMTFLRIGRESTEIVDMQPYIIDLINRIILI